MIIERYPYTNFHEMNLDWILHQISELKKEIAALPEMDEKIKELEEMLANLNEALAHALGMGIVDNSNYNLFAQILPDANNRFNSRMYSQGFCFGEDAGRPTVAQMFVDIDPLDPDHPHTLFTITDLTTGNRLVSYVDTLEHGNSLTWVPPLNKYLCATAGNVNDQGALVEINTDGSVSMYHYLPEPVWAVSYNQDVIYAISKTGKLYKIDLTFNIMEEIELELDNDFIYQGMAADDLYLYLFNGNTIPANTDVKNINRCSVFSHDGLPVKQVYMNYPLEIEEGDFLNGEFYLSSNTTHCALICKADMYTKNRSCSFGVAYDNIDLNQNGIEIHVKEDYADFLVDGSNDHPLSAITWLMLWLRNSTDRMNIKIDTDITQTPTLSFRRCPNTIFDIDAQGNKLPNLLFDGGTLYLNNAVLPGIDSANSITFHGRRLVLNNITFGESGSAIKPERLIFCTCSYEINGLVINQNATFLLYSLSDGYLRNVTFNESSYRYGLYTGEISVDSNFSFWMVRASSDSNLLNNSTIKTSSYNKTFSMNDVGYSCVIAQVGGTINDLPAGMVRTDIMMIRATRYRSSISANNMLFEYFKTDGTLVVERRMIV